MYGLIKILIDKIRRYFQKKKFQSYLNTPEGKEMIRKKEILNKTYVSIKELQANVSFIHKERNISVNYLLNLLKKKKLINFESPKCKKIGTKLNVNTYNDLKELVEKEIEIDTYTPKDIDVVANSLATLLIRKAYSSK